MRKGRAALPRGPFAFRGAWGDIVPPQTQLSKACDGIGSGHGDFGGHALNVEVDFVVDFDAVFDGFGESRGDIALECGEVGVGIFGNGLCGKHVETGFGVAVDGDDALSGVDEVSIIILVEPGFHGGTFDMG